MTLGSRIMTVSDIFAAITEDRPYRKGMEKEKAVNVLEQMVERNEIDKNVVKVLFENYDNILQVRKKAQKATLSNLINSQHRLYRRDHDKSRSSLCIIIFQGISILRPSFQRYRIHLREQLPSCQGQSKALVLHVCPFTQHPVHFQTTHSFNNEPSSSLQRLSKLERTCYGHL